MLMIKIIINNNFGSFINQEKPDTHQVNDEIDEKGDDEDESNENSQKIIALTFFFIQERHQKI